MFSLWFAVVGAFARGDCKLLETEIARIYVPTCCFSIGKMETERERECYRGACSTAWLLEGERAALLTHTWILTDGYLHLLTCTCVLTLGYLHLLTHSVSHLDTDTWILTVGYLLTYPWILILGYR